MKKAIFLLVMSVTILTPEFVSRAQDRPESQARRSIIEQLTEWISTLGVGFGAPTAVHVH